MVDTEEKLQKFLPVIKSASWVALDTEADSLHAYPEKVCLIQVSTASGDRLVDPLAALNLAPLLEAFSGHELIMHGADYDLRLLQKHHRFVPSAVFDTMLAARLLGVRKFGLGDLVHDYLGVKLEKGPQKANWAIRPLTARLEAYARNDTRYLKPLSDGLKSELQAKNRLEWHKESCARLIHDCTRERAVDMEAIWRVKGSHLLNRPALAALRELWRWREKEAVAANKPPFFVMSHQGLVDIAAAVAAGKSYQALLPRHLSQRRREGIADAVERALAISPEHHPRIPRPTGRRPSESERKKFLELQRRRDTRAAELGIDATVIASRSMLSELAHNCEKASPLLMKWQRELLSEGSH